MPAISGKASPAGLVARLAAGFSGLMAARPLPWPTSWCATPPWVSGVMAAPSTAGLAQRNSRATMRSRSRGLARVSLTPAALAASRSSARTPAVKAMMGRSIRPSSPRIRRVAVRPSMTGIRTSISTASKARGLAFSSCRACWPSAARVAVAPSSARARSIRSRFMALSSTTRIWRPIRRGPSGRVGVGAPGMASVPPATREKGSSNQKVLPWPG